METKKPLSARLQALQEWFESRMHTGGGFDAASAKEFTLRMSAAAIDAEILELGINPETVPAKSILGVAREMAMEPEGGEVVQFPRKRIARIVPINNGGAA